MSATLRLLVVLALRNVAAHRTKSVIVGSILFFGTAIVVAGGALLDSVERSMEKSITSSLAGNLQVYAASAKDPLQLYGGFAMNPDVGEIPDLAVMEEALRDVPNVKDIVPMGIVTSTVFGSNELDLVLGRLREQVRASSSRGHEDTSQTVAQVRRIVATLQEEQPKRAEVMADPEKAAQEKDDLARAASDVFWASFATEPLLALDFLDGRIAPMAADGRIYYLRTLGVDLDHFAESFDRFYIVEGEPVPAGQRGFLMSQRTYELFVKNKVAREIDAIHTDVVEEGAVIAEDTFLQERIARNARQYQRIVFQLQPADATKVEAALRAEIGGEGGLDELVQRFLLFDDANLQDRFDFFYAEIAPRIRLHDVSVGDEITLRAYSKSGYVKSINVKLWGTYEFSGLEKSDLQSATNLTDLVTFRELYGKMTEGQRAELDSIKASVGARSIDRASAEDALFGGGADLVTEAAPSSVISLEDIAPVFGTGLPRSYDAAELDRGLALNAAILLDDPSRIAETAAALDARIAERGLDLQVVDWKTAAGMLGQFIVVIRIVLLVSIGIIFLVALVIINNSMVMATMDRVAEIGTMRAIGAQRSLVVALFLLETLLLGAVAGTGGAAAGAALVSWLGHVGIPAGVDVLVILFAGPRLYPTWGLSDLAFGMASVIVVGALSTLYPAILASRIQPIVAMQGKE